MECRVHREPAPEWNRSKIFLKFAPEVTEMKIPILYCILAVVGSFLGAPLFAQDNQRSSVDVEERLAKYLKRFPESDGDGDGRLTTKEFQAFRKTLPANTKRQTQLKEALKRFPNADADQNGTLTIEEFREFQTKQRNRSDSRRMKPSLADIAYGQHEKQRFDLWPVDNASQPTPLVIYIHGGGFRGGDKSAVKQTQVELFRDNGVAFASMNYRLSDVGPYPIMMHDAARCLQTIRHKADQWNIDPNRIACFGGSAGAGISLWLAFHDDLADAHSDDPVARQSTRIIAAGTLNGQSTYDMHTYRDWFDVPDLPMHDALPALFDVRDESELQRDIVKQKMQDASPIIHLSKDDQASVYMVYNRGDTPVNKNTPQGEWVHHVRLGWKLQEAMERLGLECIVRSPKSVVGDDPDGSLEKFLIRKVTQSTSE